MNIYTVHRNVAYGCVNQNFGFYIYLTNGN
jgi:hypothetical protein